VLVAAAASAIKMGIRCCLRIAAQPMHAMRQRNWSIARPRMAVRRADSTRSRAPRRIGAPSSRCLAASPGRSGRAAPGHL